VDAGARFVKTDVAVVADAQYLQVNAAGCFNALLVCGTVLLDLFLRPFAIRNKNVCRINVHMLEELAVHKPVVAL
jgi:hypothetical protein